MRWDLLDTIDALDDKVIDECAVASGASVFYRSSFLKQYQRAPVTDLEPAGSMIAVDGDGVDALVPLFVRRGANPFAADEPASVELLTPMPHCYDAQIDPAWLADSEFFDVLRSAARARGCERVVLESVTTPYTSVAAPPTSTIELFEGAPRYMLDPIPVEDAYLAGLSRATRRSLRRNIRLARQAGAVDHLARAADAPLDAVIGLCLDTAAALLAVAVMKSHVQATTLANLFALLSAGIGGALAPRALLPAWTRFVSPVTPHYWFLKSVESAIGLTSDTEGLVGAAVLCVAAVVVFVLAVRWFQSDDEKAFGY